MIIDSGLQSGTLCIDSAIVNIEHALSDLNDFKKHESSFNEYKVSNIDQLRIQLKTIYLQLKD